MRLIKGNIIQAISLKELITIENGGILLSDHGTIIDVYSCIPEDLDCEVIDYGDKLIMQSFCDMHLHAPQFPMLGMGMDLPLLKWLDTYTYKTEANFSNIDYARLVYRKLASELIKNGTTRVCIFGSIHEESNLILMEELERAGVTGFVGKVNMDQNSSNELIETTEESLNQTIKFICDSKKFSNVKPIITPRFTPTCSNELLMGLGNIARNNNLYIQSHLSENKNEIAWVKKLHPDCKLYWESYYKNGLWCNKTLMAHCVYSNSQERKAMKDYNVVCVHCPDSNINLSSGICPIRTFLDEGIWVVLGSDIAAGSQISMAENIRTAIKVSKLHNIDEKKDAFLSVKEAYYLATTSAQLYFDGGIGFEKGHKLHAIVVDDSNFCVVNRKLSLEERFERTIYNMNKEDIVSVFSEGRHVF